ncbi:uncharacterized protein BDR25DRAFT_122014 [Lindgomyces ingoldianus]|uniref:Uncharacterized protein n=1 Tax=Lindgomyces ingoldianus TaxID=673940 RepID=A0ACB6R7Z1_9PLEO|nr:uncharacterized protein BDR25DRAFT_122014 [Lindgomyces ingoldianus]KAF2474440.1 hypothetical protein BDR25DRAFT_122014 [Lindgomyces ingoldianus]
MSHSFRPVQYPPQDQPHELSRISFRSLRNGFGSSSIRSKSPQSIVGESSWKGYGSPAPPSIQVEHHDSSSQTTAVNTETGNTPPSEPNDLPIASPPNSRIDSDPATGGSGPTPTNSDDWDERNAIVPRSNLTVIDVAALILNKMVGTGIFTTPGTVLAFTRSKGISVGLWAVGGLWSSLFLLVYLEFGNALPFNGGELIYLDEIYRTPELLFTILFSGYFLVLGNSYGNAVQFAKHVLLAANPNVEKSAELDARLVRLIAILCVSLVCLIHYSSSKAGLFLNKALAWYKVILLFVVFVAGMAYSHKHGSQLHDKTAPARGSSLDAMSAMISVFYTYQGWENANYVAGEIRALEGRTPTRRLKIGAFLAVGVVWILYILVSLAYYKVLDYKTITGGQSDLGAALYFAPKVFGSSFGMKICLAISAFGNVVAITYTASKVKQTIALQRILPFWRFFQKDLPQKGNETPFGGLVLHWISSVVFIAICPVSADGYSFTIGLFTYGHIFWSMLVAIGLWFLKSRMEEQFNEYRFTIFQRKWTVYTVPIIFALGTLLVLIFSAKPILPGKIPRYWWPATFFLILLGSFLYWSVIRIVQIEVTYKGKIQTIGQIIGFEIIVYDKDTINVPKNVKDSVAEALAAKIDGSGRRVECRTSGRVEKLEKGLVNVKERLVKWLL